MTINLDSKLEASAIIYLVDFLGATKISRFKSILHFSDSDNINHRFNPDFFCIIENIPTVVEVKQIYRKSPSVNNYNKFLHEKEQALKEFCDKRNYSYIWLTPENSDLKKIYSSINKILALGAGLEPAIAF